MDVNILAYSRLSDPSLSLPGETECDSIVMLAIAECYQTQPSRKALKLCFKEQHLSVFEHLSFTFRIRGISRACLAQLTRHRMASYTVESQRFCNYTKKPYRFVIPPSCHRDTLLKQFTEHVRASQELYKSLIEEGVPPEDARFVLPEASGVNLTMTANARELMHIFNLRLHRSAQWEIRNLCTEMLKLVKPLAPLTFEAFEVPISL